MTTVSVVIPAYNAEETLPKTIASACAQTYDDLEIIVVDDASTDDTVAVLDGFDDPRIQFFSHEENRGGSAARNTGIERATGDYIAFLDADDEWHPRKIEKQLDELKRRSDEWVAVHCARSFQMGMRARLGYVLAKVVGTRKKAPPREGGEELIKEILLLNLSTGASTLLVDREVVRAIGGFDPAFPRHQDWEFLIRVLQQGYLAYVDEPLVIKHGTGRPSTAVHEDAKNRLLSKFAEEIETLENQGYPVTHVQRLHLAKLYLEEGNIGRAREQIRLSSVSGPELLSLGWSLVDGILRRATGSGGS